MCFRVLFRVKMTIITRGIVNVCVDIVYKKPGASSTWFCMLIAGVGAVVFCVCFCGGVFTFGAFCVFLH